MMAFGAASSSPTSSLRVATLVIPPISSCSPTAGNVKVPDKFTQCNLKAGAAAINFPAGWD